MFVALAVCPTGWGFDPEYSDEIARLAIETGVWPLKEAIRGQVRHTYVPSHLYPVRDYLEPQRRFRHLFKPRVKEEQIAQIQARVNAYWQAVARQEEGAGTPQTSVVRSP